MQHIGNVLTTCIVCTVVDDNATRSTEDIRSDLYWCRCWFRYVDFRHVTEMSDDGLKQCKNTSGRTLDPKVLSIFYLLIVYYRRIIKTYVHATMQHVSRVIMLFAYVVPCVLIVCHIMTAF